MLLAYFAGLYHILTLKSIWSVFKVLFEGLGKHTCKHTTSQPHTKMHIMSKKLCGEVCAHTRGHTRHLENHEGLVECTRIEDLICEQYI